MSWVAGVVVVTGVAVAMTGVGIGIDRVTWVTVNLIYFFLFSYYYIFTIYFKFVKYYF
jgi:hypothetical protein